MGNKDSCIKLEMMSDHISDYISKKVEKKTGYPLVKTGNYSYAYIKETDNDALFVPVTHNGKAIKYHVVFRKGMMIEVEKYKKEYMSQLNYVANYIIDYINNGYEHR